MKQPTSLPVLELLHLLLLLFFVNRILPVVACVLRPGWTLCCDLSSYIPERASTLRVYWYIHLHFASLHLFRCISD